MIAVVLFVAALVAAACTGDDDSAAPTTSTSPPSTAAPTATGLPATTSTTAPPPRLAPCPADIVPPPAFVRRFHDPAGACLPLGAASIYRCRRVAPVPVAVVAGRRYLGGPHATLAAPPPPTATEVGRATDGTVLRLDPADPNGLIVTNHVSTRRWPVVPLHVTPSGVLVEGIARPAVFVVGDSVILGAEPQLRAAFGDWSFTMDAAVSRSTTAGLDVLRVRRGEVADIVVVALGYNDGGDVAGWTNAATQVLDELATVPLVVWVNLREARGYYAEDNAALAQLASVRPNVRIADWRAASAAVPPTEFAADGLHLRPAAADAMAGLVNGTVRAWYAEAGQPDQGDQSCRPAVDAVVAAGR